jgi:hypothetical protein
VVCVQRTVNSGSVLRDQFFMMKNGRERLLDYCGDQKDCIDGKDKNRYLLLFSVVVPRSLGASVRRFYGIFESNHGLTQSEGTRNGTYI